MKKSKCLIATIMGISLLVLPCACTKTTDISVKETTTEETTIETTTEETTIETTLYDPIVDTIDYSVPEGELRYVGIERADSSLLEGIGSNSGLNFNKVMVLKFDYTNLQQMPADVQSTFYIEIYQNGVQLTDSPAHTSPTGNRQANLIEAYFSSVLNGGTANIGTFVILNDYSPITIYVYAHNASWEFYEDYQVMEIDVSNYA